MPSNALIKAGTISEEHLVPHLRNKINNSGGVSITGGVSSAQKITIQMKVDVSKNKPISIDDDGKAILFTGEKPLFAITKNEAKNGQYVECYKQYETIILNQDDLKIGAEVFCINGSFMSTYYYVKNKYNQNVGKAVSNNSFIYIPSMNIKCV